WQLLQWSQLHAVGVCPEAGSGRLLRRSIAGQYAWARCVTSSRTREHGPALPYSTSGSRHDSLRPIIICSCSFRCAASVSVWPLPVCCPPLVWRGLPHTCSGWTCFYFFYTQFLIWSGLLTDKAYAYGSSCLAVLYPFYFPQWGFAGRRPASYGVCATA